MRLFWLVYGLIVSICYYLIMISFGVGADFDGSLAGELLTMVLIFVLPYTATLYVKNRFPDHSKPETCYLSYMLGTFGSCLLLTIIYQFTT